MNASRSAVARPLRCELTVMLSGIQPLIWRQFVVPGAITLAQLHQVLQAVMGWEDQHLYQFMIAGVRYGDPRVDESGNIEDARSTRLAEFAGDGFAFSYTYDFGDDWMHIVVVDAVRFGNGAEAAPTCLAGARACPPEDCGGTSGYQDLLQALADPNHPEHDDLRDWVGSEFEPETFDRDAINGRLRRTPSIRG